MASTSIEWATDVWNPVTGCTKVSPGCAHCYAERMAKRLKAMGRPEYQNVIDEKGRWNGNMNFIPERLEQPLRWKKARRIFVDSMSDLFHPNLNDDHVYQVIDVMLRANWHEYMVLTKQAKRMEKMIKNAEAYLGVEPLPNHIWFGVSVENQKEADERIPWLLSSDVTRRFLSCEPLLGPLDLTEIQIDVVEIDSLRGKFGRVDRTMENCGKIDLVIAGGESGPRARPMHPDWVRSLRDQCVEAGTKFFFKQWGEWSPDCLCQTKKAHRSVERPQPGKRGVMFHCGKKRAGRVLDGRTWDEML